MVEKNIIKYIALGFSKAIREKDQPKPLYDKELGLVSEGNKDPLKSNAVKKGWDYMKRHIKEFFEFNNQPPPSQLSKKDNNEGAVLDG